MIKSCSIAEAGDNPASIVHDMEEASAVELTRRGEPVAVLLSVEKYRRMAARGRDLWVSLTAFRERVDPGQLDIGPEVFEGLRDPSPGREASPRG